MSNSMDDAWQEQPADPDPCKDLDYELVDWTTVSATQNGDDYLMYIPEEEEMLREDEFIVIEADDVVDLVENT